MARRPATVTQADIARVIRAAKQAGAAEVVVKAGAYRLVEGAAPARSKSASKKHPETGQAGADKKRAVRPQG